MQSDPCRAGAHASCVQPDLDCDCVCHKGEGTKEAWQEGVRANLDREPTIGPIYISRQKASALCLVACYEERAAAQSLKLGSATYAEEDWVIQMTDSGDLLGATYPSVSPNTTYYPLKKSQNDSCG